MESLFILQIVVVITLISLSGLGVAQDSPASFPLQLTADIEITAHLIDESSEYPPRKRRIKVYYDYIQKLARADIAEGYEAAKTYIRRYDQKNEYMVRYPPINDCKRSYLGDIMPFPDIPRSSFVGVEDLHGVRCKHYVFNEHSTRVHMYFNENTNAPVKLIQESVENEVSKSLLTYDYSNVTLHPQDPAVYDIPNSFSHSTCERHTGGFPYLHIFHYFVRF